MKSANGYYRRLLCHSLHRSVGLLCIIQVSLQEGSVSYCEIVNHKEHKAVGREGKASVKLCAFLCVSVVKIKLIENDK
jgi:hypothetical protein